MPGCSLRPMRRHGFEDVANALNRPQLAEFALSFLAAFGGLVGPSASTRVKSLTVPEPGMQIRDGIIDAIGHTPLIKA